MSVSKNLNERHQSILKATIRHYIATAEPVGSKTLAEEYNFSISSATIRNTLGNLEKAGLLYQPHTSAGRIPSDSGYRIYVDRLLAPNENFAKKLEDLLEKKLQTETTNFESLLQKAAKVLARLSGYIILITPPQNSANILKHLQLVPVSAKQAILIVVTECFQTQSIVIDAPEFTNKNGIYEKDLVEEELQILSNFLNSKLKGKTCAELVTLDWSELDRKFAKSADFLRKLLTVLSRLHTSVNHTPILMTGISEALRQPEFSQMQQVQMLLHLLEEQPEQLLPLILEVPEFERTSPKVTVRIGAENPLEPMRICSLIAANYYRDRVPVGSVSAIGPTRMLYENTILMVEATADYLSEILS